MAESTDEDRPGVDRGVVGQARLGTWTFQGATGTHTIELVSGEHGSGKTRVRVDGQPARAIETSKRPNFVFVSGRGGIDGHEVSAYVQKRGRKANVECDVFVDGVSLTTGEPVRVVWDRVAAADNRKIVVGCLIVFLVVVVLVVLEVSIQTYDALHHWEY